MSWLAITGALFILIALFLLAARQFEWSIDLARALRGIGVILLSPFYLIFFLYQGVVRLSSAIQTSYGRARRQPSARRSVAKVSNSEEPEELSESTRRRIEREGLKYKDG